MLNKDGQRELAYVVKVDSVEPIQGRDRVECARVGGWTCMVPKNAFKPGDLGIYFEIDSKLDTTKSEFAFTEKYHGKIKTQKFSLKDENSNKVGQFWSQGLLMAASDFGWELNGAEIITNIMVKNNVILAVSEGDFLTKELGVTYADSEDNKRKSNKTNSNAKYQKMMNRHPKLARSKFGRWCMKHDFAKKLLFLLLGRNSDKPNKFPFWVVKTDEERIQNLVGRIDDFRKELWYCTEKVDGTSTTFTIKGRGRKQEYFVCSRNVCFDTPEKAEKCYYDSNVYLEMSEKYSMKKVLKSLMDSDESLLFVTIQGETYGGSIQKRDYSMKEHDLAVFNVIFGLSDGTTKRLNPVEMKELMDTYSIPTVPIVETGFELPATCEEILAYANGKSMIDGGMREGIVFRSYDGKRSFKAVDNEFLVKYH